MHVIVRLTVFYYLICLVSNQSPKEPTNDGKQKITTKRQSITDSPQELNKNKISIWNRPQQNQVSEDFIPYKTIFRVPYTVTRLAKTLASGFDPYFDKGHFEPFERRSKPVTLVAFRKNGILPRRNVRMAESTLYETAELQSPYNDINNFWQEEILQ